MEKVLIRNHKKKTERMHLLFSSPYVDIVKVGTVEKEYRIRECYGLLYYPGDSTTASIFRCPCMFTGSLENRFDVNIISKSREIASQLHSGNTTVLECTVCRCDCHAGCAERIIGDKAAFTHLMQNMETTPFFCSEGCKYIYSQMVVNKDLLDAHENLKKITSTPKKAAAVLLDPITGESLKPKANRSAFDIDDDMDDVLTGIHKENTPNKKIKNKHEPDVTPTKGEKSPVLVDIPFLKSSEEDTERKTILFYHLVRTMNCADNCNYLKVNDKTKQSSLHDATASVVCASCGEHFHTECHGYKKGNGYLYSQECKGAHIYCSRPECMDEPIQLYIDSKKKEGVWADAYDKIPNKLVSKLSYGPKNPLAKDCIRKHVFAMMKKEYTRRHELPK